VLVIPTAESHLIPDTVRVSEIVAVEQVWDATNVPVQRILYLVLGYPDSRNEPVAPKLRSSSPRNRPPPRRADGRSGGVVARHPAGRRRPGAKAVAPGRGGRRGGASAWNEVNKSRTRGPAARPARAATQPGD